MSNIYVKNVGHRILLKGAGYVAQAFTYLLIYIALFALLSGCTGGTPSEADARQEFGKESKWSYEIKNGVVKVLSFKKVNGQAMEFMGVKFYEMDYEAQLEFLKNTPQGVSGGPKKAGDRITVKGKIEFEKTEKGWRGKSGAVY